MICYPIVVCCNITPEAFTEVAGCLTKRENGSFVLIYTLGKKITEFNSMEEHLFKRSLPYMMKLL